MGLTIHYDLKCCLSKKDVQQKLERVRQGCLDLPFAEVGEVQSLVYTKQDVQFYRDLQRKFFYPNNTDENRRLRDKLLKERGLDIHTMIGLDMNCRYPEDHEIVELKLWAGSGCEPTDFTLENKSGVWVGNGFTKTQYAEEFVKCHLLVISALDLMSKVGFEVGVRDEGHYWETRDIRILASNINDYTNLLSSLAGAFKKWAGENDMEVVAEIDKSKNIIKID